MGTWASYDDIVNRWVGDDLPDDIAVVNQLVLDAEDLIRYEFPDVQDRIDDEDLDVGRVKRVVANVVIRYLRNPQGYRSRQETTGPFGESFTVAGDRPGELWLTDADRALLSGDSGGRRPKAFTIDPTPRPSPLSLIGNCAINAPEPD